MNEAIKPNVERKSNLELFRIISMILIIAHHYVVNSGLTSPDGAIAVNPLSIHSIFLLLWGAWGKIGINYFVLFSGYFMCHKSITLRKYLKLLCEVYFYNIIIMAIFWVTGYEKFSVAELAKLLIPVRQLRDGFASGYLVFFLFIPFLNLTVHHMTEKQHIKLLALVSFTYIFLGTFRPTFSVTMNYASWFMVVYLISSYIRLYPKKIFDNTKFWGISTFIFLLISSVSVVASTWSGVRFNKGLTPYTYVSDSNTLLAVLTGLSAFMFFKNLRIPQNRFINTVAATTFGILLIHANSDTMRQWLWKDTLNNVGHYYSRMGYLHAVGCVLAVFVACSLVDYLRIKFVEKPFFKAVDRKLPYFIARYNRIEEKLFKKCHIQ